MEIQVLKKLNSLKLILFWNLFLAIILVLSACGDLVKESDTGACNNAIDSRNYDTALTVCTSRKDKASAYMGKAGYDIINLLDASSKSTKKYADDESSLGKDDNSGLAILNILQMNDVDIKDDTERATAIANSKNYLDSASDLLHPYLSDNSSPLSTDEILLNTFALAFAMQLNQLILYDNATTSKTKSPKNTSGSLKCEEVSGADGNEKLKALDGHLWTSERDGMQCALMLNAINALNATDKASVLSELITWASAGGLLPVDIRTAVCDPIISLISYLSKLSDSVKKLTLSGDNTKAITEAQASTDNLTITVGCKKP